MMHRFLQTLQRSMRGATQALLIVLVVTAGMGATCIPKRNIPEFQPKPVFTNQPSTDQLIEVLNRSRAIQSLQSNFVTVNPNKMRNLDATLVWQRQRLFRMTGGVSRMLGNNFEVGSNDEWFWMAIRGFGTPQLYVARHAEFEAQPVRRVLPISPLWIIEAMGVIEVDPNQPVQQVARPDGMLEWTTFVPSSTGTYTRTLVVDPRFALTRQIFLKDPTGRLVATAVQSEHEYYPSIGLSLPHRVVIQLSPVIDPPTEIDITVGKYAVNSLDAASSGASGYELHNTNGYEVVNLVQFNQGAPQAVTPVHVAPAAVPNPQAYRGVPWDGTLLR
jgi:hypothetical protein